MSKNKPYQVEANKVESLKWDDLIKANTEALTTIDNIGKKLVELVGVIKNDTDDLELFKLIDGVSNSIITVKNKTINTSKLHGMEREGKFHFFSGVIDIDNKKHTELYLNVLSLYAEIGRLLTNEISDKGITAIMERYNTVMLEQDNVKPKGDELGK
jgi:hypothetical protein